MNIALLGAACRFIPGRIERKVRANLFQPGTGEGILEKIIRKHIDREFLGLADDSKARVSEEYWNGPAGAGWIEEKRKRYKSGKMSFFIDNFKGPFESMVLSHLEKNRDIRSIVDIGTGCGQFCFGITGKLPGGYSISGIDLNKDAIEGNIREAQESGLSGRISFECNSLDEWILSQNGTPPTLFTSLAVFKFFPKEALINSLREIRRRYKTASIAVCDEYAESKEDGGGSKYTGTTGFSHDYPGIFREEGFNIDSISVNEIGNKGPVNRFIFIVAKI